MTHEDILRMAREAGFAGGGCEALFRFAALVAAAEHEAIIQAIPGGHFVDPQWVCDMIRARSEK